MQDLNTTSTLFLSPSFSLSLWLVFRYGQFLDILPRMQSRLSLPAIDTLWNLPHHIRELCCSVD